MYLNPFTEDAPMATKPATPKTPRKAGARPGAGRGAKPKAIASAPNADEAIAGAEGAAPKAGGGVRLKELVDRVVAATGGKKAGVKEIVEATLLQMGEALKMGDTLNLPAFGKMRVARQGAEGSGAMTLKLRQGGGQGGGLGKGKANADKVALAEADDQD